MVSEGWGRYLRNYKKRYHLKMVQPKLVNHLLFLYMEKVKGDISVKGYRNMVKKLERRRAEMIKDGTWESRIYEKMPEAEEEEDYHDMD